ncbi:Nicotinamidase-related amidase [Halobacillus karajensis]|uniref:Isochorismatase family protein YecD n=1 Tax=Halobacillus karajensis TaxID=195088 RepID=A0A024P3P0_9BACI|nr:isochorismatase family cysteine hydrolase [Halobacillus karajensis]CDQ18669.1 Isochorismatase family protein YecD [Halobacillus karajensis]CDQ23259.1 Isochorismatase family protein YecD [Halobacillus karajensis]CDQ26741.1 Isochorismatase family protein YecD [Halobacillus karajensis]SEH48369.1 Nicotinamidase-related amidase [Halobacillus karajensis]
MKRALIVIDYTNDFVADEGALTCGQPAQKLEDYVTTTARQFLDQGDLVVLGVDVHEEEDPYHPETNLFPPHNIRGTKGQELFGTLHTFYQENHHDPNLIYMEKTRYSAFAGTDLEIKLNERGVTDLHLIGVCTDICVLHTAVDAYNRQYNLHIHKDGVGSFNKQGHDWALSHFEKALGASIFSSR